jgi:outer membrane receptor protein (ferrienterochelin and colicin)
MGKKFYVMMAVLAFATGSMDVNAVYTLDGIEVSADREKDRFGNMITEQSYYRTGGDV